MSLHQKIETDDESTREITRNKAVKEGRLLILFQGYELCIHYTYILDEINKYFYKCK